VEYVLEQIPSALRQIFKKKSALTPEAFALKNALKN